jgi:hypothetical protein
MPRGLTTEIERRGQGARFVVTATDPQVQCWLEQLGYLGEGNDRFATVWFPDSPDIPRYHERFAASIEQMVLQKGRVIPAPWEDALLEFLRRVEGSDLRWWLYGSAALAVRGVDVSPGDIDVNVNDATLAGDIFDDLLVSPVFKLDRWAAGYVGRAFEGAIIEWLADPHSELDDAANPYEQGPYVSDRLETVEWRGHSVCIPPLSAHLASAERRGLSERAQLIVAAMNS